MGVGIEYANASPMDLHVDCIMINNAYLSEKESLEYTPSHQALLIPARK